MHPRYPAALLEKSTKFENSRPKVQMSGRGFKTLGRGPKVPAEDLEIRPKVLKLVTKLVYKPSAEDLETKSSAEDFIKSGP